MHQGRLVYSDLHAAKHNELQTIPTVQRRRSRMKVNQLALAVVGVAMTIAAGGVMSENAHAESFVVDGNQALNTNNSFRKIDGQPRMSTYRFNANDADQQFDRMAGNQGGTLLRQRSTGKCLNAHRITNGSEINVWPCNPNDRDQNFNLLSQGSGYFLIQRTGTNQCVDSPDRVDAGKIHMWQCISNNSNQRWRSSTQVASTPAPAPNPAPVISGNFPQPNFGLSFYRRGNIFWNAGFAPASTNPPNPKLGQSKGNCTWYASGRAKQLGRNASNVDKLTGDASRWGTQATNARLNISNQPQSGAIAQWDYGHVAIVESVNRDGTITISESSYSAKLGSSIDYLYGTRTISASNPTRYIMP